MVVMGGLKVFLYWVGLGGREFWVIFSELLLIVEEVCIYIVYKVGIIFFCFNFFVFFDV